jgi:thioredoxin-dependent peroxiredoxin
VILGASFDTQAENKAFAEKFNYNFPLLCDTDRNLGLAYGACDNASAGYANRITYVIGPDGRVQQAYPAVKPKNHPQEILALL